MPRVLSLIVAGLLFAGLPRAVAAQENCWEQAGIRYGVSPQILVAIAMQESSLKPDTINRNSNGTTDYGLMGVNTVWLKELRQFGITEAHLMHPCVNVHIGAWIYSLRVREFGNTWRAVGAYHSKTPSKLAKYMSAIQRHYLSLIARPRLGSEG